MEGETQIQQNTQQDVRRNDNTVYVGKKGIMGYVLAVVTQFNNGATDVAIKRGKQYPARLTLEIVRNRFMPNATVKGIRIKTEAHV